jgi:hypothetical protein
MRLVLPALAAAGLLTAATAAGQQLDMLSRHPIKGLVVPFYTPGRPDAVMVLRAESISMEFERRGFFRIGTLPLVVAEGVTLELQRGSDMAEAQNLIHNWLEELKRSGRLELRRFCARNSQDPSFVLRIGRLRSTQFGQWQLTEGIQWQSSTNRRSAARGVLCLRGPQAGQVMLEGANPPFSVSLFSLEPPLKRTAPTSNSP